MEFIVYGKRSVCPNCFLSPSSIEVYHMFKKIVKESKNNKAIYVKFVDVEQCNDDRSLSLRQAFEVGERDYPLLICEGTILGEGSIFPESICSVLKKIDM